MTLLAPLLSVNEPESQVLEILVRQGQQVSAGDVLCVLATTKANFDVEAETSGYVQRILIAVGDTVPASAPLFEIGAEPPAMIEQAVSNAAVPELNGVPAGVRITQKAVKLARELRVDPTALPADVLVTEAVVRSLAHPGRVPDVKPAINAREVLIYGAGGHAKTIIDLLRQTSQFHLAGIVADPPPGETNLLGVPILGASDVLPALYADGIRLIVNAVGGLQSTRVRIEIFERLAKLGYAFPAILHRTAVIEPSAAIAPGVQVFGLAFIGSASSVGFGAIINTGAIVSHDCVIGEYVHLAPGALLAGHVKVGTGALVGMGVTTHMNVTIGEWTRLGNGARIHGDVPPHTVVQAGTSWPV